MEQLYRQLIGAYTSAHQEQNGKTVQLNVAGIWKEMKAKNNSEQLTCAVKQQVQEWNQKAMKKKATLLNFWSKPMKNNIITSVTSTTKNTAISSDFNQRGGPGYLDWCLILIFNKLKFILCYAVLLYL